MLQFKNNKLDINLIAMILIGVFCSAYVIFFKLFAEFHLSLPFLDFPIFNGEFLLFFCLVLFFMKYRKNPKTLTRIHYWIIAYFGFVLIKALYGYMAWGPLAFRHAALFYYPVFIVFGYAFYRREYFEGKMGAFLLLLIFVIITVSKFYVYWIITLVALGLILINSCFSKAIKILVLTVFLVIIPYERFFLTSRMMIVANLLAGVYLAVTLPITLKIKKKLKIVIGIAIGLAVLFALYHFSPHAALKSIVNFKRMVNVFNAGDVKIQAKINHFKFTKLDEEVKLYNPDYKPVQVLDEKVSVSVARIDSHKTTKVEIRRGITEQVKTKVLMYDDIQVEGAEDEKTRILNGLFEQAKQEIQNSSFEQDKLQIPVALVEKVKEEMILDLEKEYEGHITDETKGWVDHNNAVFRLFIWRDMLVDLAKEKPILGFDFGKPLRSISLEILNWGTGDWARDGWISPHNSYLHFVYRAGIVGILVIFGLFIILFKMIKEFILRKSIAGILLCAILINWFAAANFLVTFELPYTAIPIWTIFGMTFAYYCQKKQDARSSLKTEVH